MYAEGPGRAFPVLSESVAAFIIAATAEGTMSWSFHCICPSQTYTGNSAFPATHPVFIF
jgi:hypothetical protein